ncbi:S24 family peptidase [Parasutterella excrementihominis]|uniref:S24 family peptidase n=1 Tax=Parasutterella excrementihominis TaxID=487175 RepID=UPI003A93B3E7
MRSVNDVRKENLIVLRERFKTLANLNLAIGKKKTDSTLSQIINGAKDTRSGNVKNLGDRLAREMETKLSLGYGWMDADHSNEAFPEDDDLIYLRRLNVSACCGAAGIQNYEDEAYVDLMGVSRVWFKENINQIRENGYEIITAAGDSMEPTLKNGDLVVIDRFDTEITKRDGVFCVLIDNDLYLKRVQRVPGSLRFISDNRLYDPFEIRLAEVESRVIVFGRMVNSLNLKRYD